MDFSVVIPSYNGKEFLRKTLLALRQSNIQPIRYIVVDDFSSDGTSEIVRTEFPEVMLIRNDKNLGPTASRNRGAKLAEGDYIVFMDNDILVRHDSILNLLLFLSRTKNAGMVGGALMNQKGEHILYNMGSRLGSGFIEIYDHSTLVGWIIESFIAVRKNVFEELKGFDEDFFMFGEGPDLSERMRKIWLKTYFVHDAVVDMLEGHTHPQWKRKMWSLLQFPKFYRKHGLRKKS